MEGVMLSLGIGLVVALIAVEGGFAQAVPLLSVYAFAAQRLNPAMEHVYKGVAKLRFAGPAVEGLYEDLIEGGDRYREQRVIRKEGRDHELPFDSEIALRNVRFSYESGGAAVLRNINLTISKNTTVGFVGATGCRKTTLVDILLGLLPQEIFLADRSVRANIAFGTPEKQIDDSPACAGAFSIPHAARSVALSGERHSRNAAVQQG